MAPGRNELIRSMREMVDAAGALIARAQQILPSDPRSAARLSIAAADHLRAARALQNMQAIGRG